MKNTSSNSGISLLQRYQNNKTNAKRKTHTFNPIIIVVFLNNDCMEILTFIRYRLSQPCFQ